LRNVRALRNVITEYPRILLAGFIGFIITPVLVHALGDGGCGLWVAMFLLTGTFGLDDSDGRPGGRMLRRLFGRQLAEADAGR
jgi:hypothetical protein